MRVFITLLIVLLLCACTGHRDPDGLDLIAIATASLKLSDTPTLRNGNVAKEYWPTVILNLKPETVQKSRDGIYIQLSSFFVESSGLYIPSRDLKKPVEGLHSDPSFLLLRNNVYSYHFKG